MTTTPAIRRIDPNSVATAYRRRRLSPTREAWLRPPDEPGDRPNCCGLLALAWDRLGREKAEELADDMLWGPRRLATLLGLDPEYFWGWVSGFDGLSLDAGVPPTAARDAGYEDGRAAAKLVFGAGASS